MNRTIRMAQSLLRLLPIVLLAGASAQAWAGSADIEGTISYSIDGDRITVEIERIANNTSNVTTGTLYVTVWMTASPDLYTSGYEVARHRITGSSNGQLEPGHYFSDIRWTLDYDAPPPGTYYVHFYTSQYPEPDTVLDSRTFTSTLDVEAAGGPADIEGTVSFRIEGDRITVEIERIANNTRGTTTGTLYVTVQMTTGSNLFGSGYRVARHRITGDSNGRLEPRHYFSDIQWSLAYQAPPPGTYYVHFYTSQYPEPDTVLDSRTFTDTVDVGGGSGSSDDDHGNSRATATDVSVPSTTSGRIDPATDKDYFRFALSSAGTLIARTSGDLDTVGTLYDRSGERLAEEDDTSAGLNFRIERRLASGTYFVAVESFEGVGDYTLHLSTTGTGSGSPDLAVESPTASVREVAPRGQFVLRATVRNRGNARSPAGTIGYYRGRGSTRTLLSEQSLPALAPSGSRDAELRVNAEATAGTYTYNICVASVAGESNTSNNCSSSVSVVVQERSGSGVTVGSQRVLGDFDGDGRDDVLLRHADGRWFFYPMNGRRHMVGQSSANLTRNLEWAVAGIGDLNGDGRDDVLLRKPATGTWYYYPMNGRRHLAGHGAANLPSDLAWSLVGIGDFDGNGRDDVLLRHDDGRWHFYPMNGRRYAAGQGTTNMTRNLEWSVAGVGDLNGDGKDDVLMRKPTTGTWYYYPMNGRRHLAGHGAANLPSDLAWSLAGIGDFDGNGRDDVLLRHDDGRWHFYPMNGRRHAAGQGSANLTRNLEWSVAGVGDLNGDGRDDVLLRKPTTGTWYYYPMNGRRHLASHGAANLTSNLDWGLATGGSGRGSGGSSAVGAPTVNNEIKRQSLTLGDDRELDLSGSFSDDQDLTYEIRSSDADVLRVSVSGSKLLLMPVAEGTATVTVTARDADGNEATMSFAVVVAGDGGETGGRDDDVNFVAVGSAGIVTSSDGIRWNVEDASMRDLQDIAYGGGLWVAVGGGTIVASDDGRNWTNVVSEDSNDWDGDFFLLDGVAFGNGRWTAVGANAILTSTDGLSWSTVYGEAWEDSDPNLIAFTADSVGYGSGLWVAVGVNDIFESRDGRNWRTLPGSESGGCGGLSSSAVAFGDGNWYTTGYGTGTVACTRLSSGWTPFIEGPGMFGWDIEYRAGDWVAVGNSGVATWGRLADTWSWIELPCCIRSAAYGNGRWVVDGYYNVGDPSTPADWVRRPDRSEDGDWLGTFRGIASKP